jgi:hypothetical protein
MIEGFEDQTYDLTDHEREVLVPLFVKALQKKVGVANAITAAQMTNGMKTNLGEIITGPRIRKIINYIRNQWLVPGLVATSKGYHIESDPHEVFKYIESLTGRINAIREIRNKFVDYHHKLLES